MLLSFGSSWLRQPPTGLPLGERTLAEYFQDSGCETFLAGKWHLGRATPRYQPTARGFDHFYGFVTGGIGYWDHVHGGGLDWQRDGVTLRESGYSTQLIADEAARSIRERESAKRMLLSVGFNAPHLSNEAPAEAIARYAHIDNPNRRSHAAMVSELDAAIGTEHASRVRSQQHSRRRSGQSTPAQWQGLRL